jgi:hypothetical protein
MPTSTSLRRAIVLILVACLTLAVPVTASAGWTKESVTQSWFLDRPAMAVESDDDLDIVYERFGTDPGLFFATNATASWERSRITSGDHWGPDIAIDAGGALHVAFASFGTDTGIHYLTNAGGPWVDTRVSTEVDVDQPSIALDGAGKVHIVYTVHGQDPGLYHLTNETGPWVRTRLASAAHDWSPDLAIDAGGTLHVVWARFAPEAPGLDYITRTAGTWSIASRLTMAYDDWPAIAVDAAGKVHMAFQRFGVQPAVANEGQLFSASNALGQWYFERMSGSYAGFRIGPPSVAFDAAANLHIVVRESSIDPAGGRSLVHYYTASPVPGWGREDLPVYVFGGRLDNPAVGILSGGGVRAAYRSYEGEWAGIFLSGPSSSEIVATSQDDVDPDLTSASGGTRHLSFDRANATAFDRGVHYGDESGGWSFERTQIGPSMSDVPGGETDVRLPGDGSARILVQRPNVEYLTNENATWESANICCSYREGALALDSAGKSHLALITQSGFQLDYETNAAGTWAGVDVWHPVYSGDTLAHPAMVVDASGRRTMLFAYQTPTFTPGVFIMSAPASGSWPVSPTRLFSGEVGAIDVVADSTNRLHVTWLEEGTDPGVYYATNRTGAWVRTRLSRSGADSSPSIALDATGKVYVAFARGYWAATPGLYLVSDRTGSWQTTRVSDEPYVGNPSVDIGPDGLVDIAYVNNVDGVSIAAETSTAGSAVRVTSASRSEPLDAHSRDAREAAPGTPTISQPGSTDPARPDRHDGLFPGS